MAHTQVQLEGNKEDLDLQTSLGSQDFSPFASNVMIPEEDALPQHHCSCCTSQSSTAGMNSTANLHKQVDNESITSIRKNSSLSKAIILAIFSVVILAAFVCMAITLFNTQATVDKYEDIYIRLKEDNDNLNDRNNCLEKALGNCGNERLHCPPVPARSSIGNCLPTLTYDNCST